MKQVRYWHNGLVLRWGAHCDVLETIVPARRNNERVMDKQPPLPFLGERIEDCSYRKQLTTGYKLALDMQLTNHRVKMVCSVAGKFRRKEVRDFAIHIARYLTNKRLLGFSLIARKDIATGEYLRDIVFLLDTEDYRPKFNDKHLGSFSMDVNWNKEV